VQASTITCFGPDGSAFDWVPIWVRLPEFLKTYPPAEGWKVEIRQAHLMDASPALLELAKVALSSGKDLQIVGLSNAELASYVFEARLVNPEGHVIRNASARVVAPSSKVKAWEAGETASLNRLLAMLGFGGGVLSEDEANDRMIQGITVSASGATGSPQATSASAQAGAVTAYAGSKTRPPKAVTGKQIEDKGVSKAVQSLILKAAKDLADRGVTVDLPELTTDAEGRKFLGTLDSRLEAMKLATGAEETIPK